MSSRLISNSMYSDYDRIFLQWQTEKIVREVPPKVKCVYFLLHHAVWKENSWTTPLRPIFDASCKTERGSINDYLHKGPNILDLLPSFLLHFCEYQVAFTADIHKAFLIFDVAEEDHDFLSFLWWSDYKNGKLQELQDLHLIFGLNCSPYLLNVVLFDVIFCSGAVTKKLLSYSLLRSMLIICYLHYLLLNCISNFKRRQDKFWKMHVWNYVNGMILFPLVIGRWMYLV